MPLLAALAALGAAVQIAIDVGSTFVKCAVLDASGVPRVALNDLNKTATPTFLAFRATRAFNATLARPLTEDEIDNVRAEWGERALSILDVHPAMGSGLFPAFAGLSAAASDALAARLLVAVRLPRFRYGDLLAIFMKQCVRQAAGGAPVERVVLAFPAGFALPQRIAFERAVAAFAPVAAVDDAAALAARYAAPGAPRTVLFVDVGGATVKAYAVAFAGGAATRLSYAIDYEAGGAFATAALVALLRARLALLRARLALRGPPPRRLFTAAERLKLALSADDAATVVVDDVGGADRVVTVTRAELEAATTLPADAVRVARRAAAGVAVAAVRVVGGAARMPCVRAALEAAFPGAVAFVDEPEAIALGAARWAANATAVSDAAQLFDVRFSSNWVEERVCAVGRPCVANVSVMGFFRRFELTYEGGPLHPALKNLSTEYKFSMNIVGNVSIWFGSQPLHVARVERCNATCLPGKFMPVEPPPFSLPVVSLFGDPGARAARLASTRQSLAELVLRVLDEVAKNATVRRFTNHTQRLEIIRKAEPIKKWVQAPETAKIDEFKPFTNRTLEVRRAIGPVYRRIENNRTFYELAERLLNLIGMAKQAKEQMKSEEEGVKPDPKFLQRLYRTDMWFNETVTKVVKTAPWEDLPVKLREVRDRYYDLEADLNRLRAQSMPPSEGHVADLDTLAQENREVAGRVKFVKEMRNIEEEGGSRQTGPKPDPDVDIL